MNKLDPFEKLLNAKLQNNEVELTFDSWNAIEKKLPSAPKSNLYYWISAAIIIGTISSAIFYFNYKLQKMMKIRHLLIESLVVANISALEIFPPLLN